MDIAHIIAISGLLNGIGALLIGLFAFFRKGKGFLLKIFALSNFSIAFWSFSYWQWMLADNAGEALLWCRILSIGSTLIPVFFLHWILVLTGKAQKRKGLIIFAYLISVVFLVFGFSQYFIRAVGPTFGFPFWPKPGILYHFYIAISYVVLLSFAIFYLFSAFKKSIGYQRGQLKYILFGTIIAILSGLSNFPLWYNINIPPLPNFLVLAYIGFFAYAMFQRRFMDFRLMVGRSVVYIFSFLVVAAFSYFLIYVVPFSFKALLPFIILFSFLVFQATKKIEEAGIKYFYPNFLKTKIVFSLLEEKLIYLLDIKTLCSLISESLKQAFLLEKIAILIKSEDKEGFDIQTFENFNEQRLIDFSENAFLVSVFRKMEKPLGIQEILSFFQENKQNSSADDFNYIKERLDEFEIEISVPLVFEKEVIGIIFLGKRNSQDAFSNQDIELLNGFSRQASVSLKNALFYNEVKKRKEELERFQKLTIGREAKMQELKEKIKTLEGFKKSV